MTHRAWSGAAALACAVLLAQGSAAEVRIGALNSAASYSDYYQITCFDNGAGAPASLAGQVREMAPAAAPLVSVQLQKGSGAGATATNATDAVDGDANASPLVWVNGGAGAYLAFVDKTDAGAETYQVSLTCTTGSDGTGAPTGTTIVPEPHLVPGLLGTIALLAWLARRRASARAVLGMSSALALSTVPSASSAHTQNGSLGAPAEATDYYQVTCSDDGSGPPVSLIVQVLESSPAGAPLVSAQVRRGTTLVNTTDPIDGDGSPSPFVSLNLGTGVYDVLVDKSGVGAETYILTYHCYTGPDGTGTHTGTSLQSWQNQ
ncbi:MAG TPA: hypothetical protein VLV15_10525 [Dongiaceae bacterium]|nr:hypothetical protein [Dongiaceae bacterium]